ncbi:MAG: nuclear transport factor 2 family protein [Actinomycetia bacterium]|nr:nuclear transport factor 2 family protein [bacterium]MCP5027735.1 nuclear transport factor 2 family protein [Actinomycetes bacterium]
MDDLSVEKFVALETAVWRTLATGDSEADRQLLTEDFLGVYPTGFASRTEHVAQLADGPTMESYEISDARLLVITPAAVMISYRAEFRRRDSSRASQAEVMFVSSLWCERDGQWLNVFSQDTPGPPR